MYSVTRLLSGRFLCEVIIQDGTERWYEDDLEDAISAVVMSAHMLNHEYIRRDQVTILYEKPKILSSKDITLEEEELLHDIKRGEKRVLEYGHYLFKYNLSEEECQNIQAIREGRAKIVWNKI